MSAAQTAFETAQQTALAEMQAIEEQFGITATRSTGKRGRPAGSKNKTSKTTSDWQAWSSEGQQE